MNGLLYFLGILIMAHCGLMIFALARMGQGKKNLYSICLGGAMIFTTLVAFGLSSWPTLVLGFAVYRLSLTLETLVLTWSRPRTPLVVPINLLMVAGAIVSFLTQIWLIFVISYCLYWAGTFLLSKYQYS